MDSELNLDTENRYRRLLLQVESVFETPKVLKEIYLNGLKSIDQSRTPNSQKTKLNNSIGALENIALKSISDAEKKNLSALYTQAIILAVSNAEFLLKVVFQTLLETFIELGIPMEKVDKINIPFKQIREGGLKLDQPDVIELLIERFDEEKNPDEKLNFQNIKSIEGHFNDYFGIKLDVSETLTKKMHLYYQHRHLQVHSLGLPDKRFLKNLEAASIKHAFILKKRVFLVEKDYEECKFAFCEFFKLLDVSIAEKFKTIIKDQI